MTAFLVAALVLLICIVPCLVLCVRGADLDAVVALELTGTLTAMVLMLLAEGLGRPALFDLALVLAMLALGSGLVFVHALERWL